MPKPVPTIALHPVFQHSPSSSATACSWFMMRVRACTIRWRCHSSCRITQMIGRRRIVRITVSFG